MPFRVPVYRRRVQSSGDAPGPQRVQSTDYGAVQQGLNNMGQAMDSIIAQQQREVAQEKHKADVIAARNQLTKLEEYSTNVMVGSSTGRSTAGTKLIEAGDQGASETDLGIAPAAAPEASPGFLSTRGLAAAKVSADTYEGLKKRREELAGELTSPEQRELFLMQADQVLLRERQRIEGHVAHQLTVAQEDSVKAAIASAVRATAADPANEDLAQERIAGIVGPASALATSPADAAAKEAAVRATITEARLDQLLARGDTASAERVLGKNRGVLGAKAEEFDKALTIAREKREADRTALTVIESARLPNGFVDAGRAIVEFQALPEEKRTDKAQEEFNRWMQLEARKAEAVKGQVWNSALGSYLQRHSLADINPKVEAWMRANDADSWHRLEQMVKQDRAGGPATNGQQAALTQFLVDVADNPEKYATMNVEAFRREWYPRLHRSDRERAGAVLAQMHAQANKPDKLSPLENKMLLQMGREAGVFDPKQNDVSKWDDDAAQNFYRAQQLLSERIANEKRATGKDPPIEKLQEWTGELLLKGKNPDATSLFGIGGGTTRLEADVKGTGFVPSWSTTEKAEAAEALRKRGARADDAAVDRLLRLKHSLPALPLQAAEAKPLEDVDPGRWGLDLSPPPEPKERTGPGKF